MLKRIRTPEPADNKPTASAEWTTPTRARVQQLKKLNYSALDIRIQTGVPERSQYRMLNAPVRRPGNERAGRPCKLDQDSVQKMIKALNGHYDRRRWSWEELRNRFKLQCTALTVKRAFNEARYYKCRACQKSWMHQKHADTRKERCGEWKE